MSDCTVVSTNRYLPAARWVLLVVGILFLASSAHAVTCDLCGTTIRGQYRVYKTQSGQMNCCTACDLSSDHCALCRLPLDSGVSRRVAGETVCAQCARNAKTCSECGLLIRDKYFTLSDTHETLCSKCFAHLPRCVRCSKPLSGDQKYTLPQKDGTRLCQQCSDSVVHCAGCSKLILSTFYRYEFTELVFCPECQARTGKCYSCGLPVGKEGLDLVDGRKICARCQDTAVVRLEELDRIWKWVQSHLSRSGFKVNNPVALQEVDRSRLRQLVQSPTGARELGAFELKNNTYTVYILYALPEALVYETLAHEYGHAWQAENCPKNLDLDLCEGFAEWVASLVLKAKGLDAVLERLEQRPDEYGRGYRKLKEMERTQGRAKMLEFVRKNTRFP